MIPTRDTEQGQAYDRAMDRERPMIERTINRLKRFRRIGARYDTLASSSLAMVTLACIRCRQPLAQRLAGGDCHPISWLCKPSRSVEDRHRRTTQRLTPSAGVVHCVSLERLGTESNDEGDVSMLSMTGGKALLGGILFGAMLLMLSSGPLAAHGEDATPGATGATDDMGMMGEAPPGAAGMMSGDDLHEAMHTMMNADHGAGTRERMHEAMGPEGEELMAQCAAMMAMMSAMGDGAMSGMMNPDMMGGEDITGTPAS